MAKDEPQITLRARDLLLAVINSQVGHEEPDASAEATIQRALDAAFSRGAREGWMRCGVFHVDLDFEGRASEHAEVNQRWPL